jgi:hypothetical protein
MSAFTKTTSNNKMGERRAYEAWNAQQKAEVKRVAELKKKEDLNFSSEKAFPSLGGQGAAKAKSTMDYTKIKFDGPPPAAPVAATLKQGMPKLVPRQAPVQAEEAEEEEEAAWSGGEEEIESEGEFNADLMSSRRRGDKGIW